MQNSIPCRTSNSMRFPRTPPAANQDWPSTKTDEALLIPSEWSRLRLWRPGFGIKPGHQWSCATEGVGPRVLLTRTRLAPTQRPQASA